MVKSSPKIAVKKAVIIGASGFIGSALTAELERHHWQITTIGRSESRRSNTEHIVYDINKPLPRGIFNDTDVVINLAGEPIYGYWSATKKRRMYDSRVRGTRHVVDALRTANTPPRLLINASAVGYYGDCDEQIVREDTAPGTDYLSKLCADWESEALSATELGIRVVIIRNGIVLGEGGLIKTLRPFFRAGLGVWLDDGKQWVPWIAIDDLVRLYIAVISNDVSQSIINGVAASSRGKDFFKAYGKSLHRPVLVGLPHQLLWPRYGGMAAAVAVSQRVVPSKTVSTIVAVNDLQKAFEKI